MQGCQLVSWEAKFEHFGFFVKIHNFCSQIYLTVLTYWPPNILALIYSSERVALASLYFKFGFSEIDTLPLSYDVDGDKTNGPCE